MGYEARLAKSFENALILPMNQKSKYIIFSDCHRGNGRANDNFLKNEFIYLAALEFYYQRDYTYLELGDGDELWENRSMKRIKEVHKHSFEILARFYRKNHLYMVYGNHDMVKKGEAFQKKYFDSYYCDKLLCEHPLCPGICFYSGIILRDCYGKKDIYLTHGHQASMMNSTFWKVNRFLVHYLWKNMELIGVPDPTSAAKNNTRKEKTERLLVEWAKQNETILITGHTHRPMVGSQKSPYFNTGSCIHPAGITGIEIENRCITLVKWSLGTKNDQTVYVRREVLGDKVCIDDEFGG